jgi:hypothetical protein
MSDERDYAGLVERNTLSHHEQMLDAQSQCVPCKLCGGHAVISDAGLGMGYYIRCSNHKPIRISSGCMIAQRRLGGWAYNVMDWWNRLHAATALETLAAENARLREEVAEVRRESELRRLDCIAEEDCKELWIAVAQAAEAREAKLRGAAEQARDLLGYWEADGDMKLSIESVERLIDAALIPVTPVKE